MMIGGIVVAKILLQSFEELALPILLTLQTEAYERSDRLAHTDVYSLCVLFHLANDRRWETDRVAGFGLAPAVDTALPKSGS